MVWKCYENVLFFCYIQKSKILRKYYKNITFFILIPILMNIGQISPFQIIFWSVKLEENNKI